MVVKKYAEELEETDSSDPPLVSEDSRVKFLFCPNLYTKRGMTKHVNKQHPHQ